MSNEFLVITSIASSDNKVLQLYASQSVKKNIPFIVIGDKRSPEDFHIEGCDYYSIERQKQLHFKLANELPEGHYSRKNIGYLVALSKGADVIIETDDDNIPYNSFWNIRTKFKQAGLVKHLGWVNAYKYFTDENIWPRGFALEYLKNEIPKITQTDYFECPIQQGLADDNPDVDAIYRFTQELPIKFNVYEDVALVSGSICPFNSQNTTWFKEAFPLLYLPSFVSFRMTDIWRSFVAQRIAWDCNWPILFHKSTVSQERNPHNIMKDFIDEIPGYKLNENIMNSFIELELKKGIENIYDNMIVCYKNLINIGVIKDKRELLLLDKWLEDCSSYLSKNV